MRNIPNSGIFTPELTNTLWNTFINGRFRRSVELIEKWCEYGVAHYVIETAMMTDALGTKFRNAGGRHVSVKYIGKERLHISISHYKEQM